MELKCEVVQRPFATLFSMMLCGLTLECCLTLGTTYCDPQPVCDHIKWFGVPYPVASCSMLPRVHAPVSDFAELGLGAAQLPVKKKGAGTKMLDDLRKKGKPVTPKLEEMALWLDGLDTSTLDDGQVSSSLFLPSSFPPSFPPFLSLPFFLFSVSSLVSLFLLSVFCCSCSFLSPSLFSTHVTIKRHTSFPCRSHSANPCLAVPPLPYPPCYTHPPAATLPLSPSPCHSHPAKLSLCLPPPHLTLQVQMVKLGDASMALGVLPSPPLGHPPPCTSLLATPYPATPSLCLTPSPPYLQVQMVKPGDASMASPFTAKQGHIMPCTDILKQGRSTLVTTVQMFKILGLLCLSTAYSLSVMYLQVSPAPSRADSCPCL